MWPVATDLNNTGFPHIVGTKEARRALTIAHMCALHNLLLEFTC